MQVFADQLENAKKYCRILLEYEGAGGGRGERNLGTVGPAILMPLAAPRVPVFGGSENLLIVSAAAAARPLRSGQRQPLAVHRALALPSQVMPTIRPRVGACLAVIEAYQTDVAATLALCTVVPTCIC